jgi:uracil-DNA glycosylase
MAAEEEINTELMTILASLKTRVLRSGDQGYPMFMAAGRTEAQAVRGEGLLADRELLQPAILPVNLSEVRKELGDCRRCPLSSLRKNLVFGEGNPRAELVFIGEAPGGDEDREGRPFVGKAGQLLTRIINAMNLKREEVYICNILKCRPPGNRNPEPPEIAACEPFLIKQIKAIAPRAICALGAFAAKTLLKTDVPITALRGRFHSYEGIKVMPTFHPAYCLRNPAAKKQVWEDVQMIMKELNLGKA